jgi:hypothetical protein
MIGKILSNYFKQCIHKIACTSSGENHTSRQCEKWFGIFVTPRGGIKIK